MAYRITTTFTDGNPYNLDQCTNGGVGEAPEPCRGSSIQPNGAVETFKNWVNGDANGVAVSGLAPTVRILHSEAANDRLEINTLAGTDAVSSAGLAAGVIQLFVDNVLIP